MTTGIIVAITLLFAVSNIFLNKTKWNRYLRPIHKIVGLVLIIMIMIHLVCTLPLIKQRPIAMYILGFVMLGLGVSEALLFYLGKHKKNWLSIHRKIAYCMVGCMLIHVGLGVGSFISYQNKIAYIHVENIELSQVKNGEYVGEYDAGYVYSKVKVVVMNGRIDSIDILEHRTELGKKAEVIVDDIVNKQEIAVDAVTGATNSSRVIEQAVYNALTGEK